MYKVFRALFLGGLLGKALGVIRELLLAGLFGATVPVAAYRTSQTATLVPVNFFTTDSLNAGFIPVYIRLRSDDHRKANIYFWVISLLLLFISVLITLVLVGAAGQWVSLLAPGFDRQAHQVTVSFLRIMAVGIPFYVLSALFSFVEIGNNSYRLSSTRSSIQSLGLIIGALLAFVMHSPMFLAWGFTGAYIAFVLWGGWSLYSKQLVQTPRGMKWFDVREGLVLFWRTIRTLLWLPILLQGNIAIERGISSILGITTVASLDYARFITDTGSLLLAVPLGLAGLAELSKLPREDVQRKLLRVVPVVLVVTVPISAFIAANSHVIVSVLYARGAFGEQAVQTTNVILTGLAVGFWAQATGYVLLKSLNAQLRNKEVAIYMAIALGLNVGVNLATYKLLGPMCLGLGASVNAIAFFILTMKACGLNKLWKHVFLLCLGCVLYVPVTLLNPYSSWIGLIISALSFAIFWLCYVAVIPSLRRAALEAVTATILRNRR